MRRQFSKSASILFPVLFLAVVQSSKAQAAGLQDWPNIKRIITNCVYTVQQKMNSKSQYSQSDFDAYLDADGVIEMFGTQIEFFEFRKCAVEIGVPLESHR
jgi:hypothetical protein